MDDTVIGILVVNGVCLFFFVMGILIMIHGIRNRKKAEESTSWPSVQGTITRAWIEVQEHRDDDGDRTIRHYPRWEYEFVVSGMTYTGQNIDFSGTQSSMSESKAREELEQYPLNSEVQVFYNPSDPGEAALEPGLEGTMTLIIYGGGLAGLMVIIVVGLAIGIFAS